MMKKGKVTGNVYSRSIHKKLNTRREEVIHSAENGEDCAVFSWTKGASPMAGAQYIAAYAAEDGGRYAVYAAVNQAAARMEMVPAVVLSVLLPADADEEQLRAISEGAERAAADLNVQIADVKASVTSAVVRPAVTAFSLGYTQIRTGSAPALDNGVICGRKETVKPGSQVIMTKWAGLEGTAILAQRFSERLLSRYPAYLISEADGFDRYLSIVPEAAAAGKSGVGAICPASEGGIFGALWTLGQSAGVGLEIGLKQIPIRQETVEICNFFDINPYQLTANGSLLVIADNGAVLLKELESACIPAAVIGTVTRGNDRVIVNGEDRRFLEPAKPDEIYKITEQ